MKKIWWKFLTALSITILLVTAYLFIPQTFLSLDNRLRDFLFVLRGPIPSNNNIVIIDIDEKSLKAEGQWPWSRDKIALLLKHLNDAEAGIIGLDIVFSEPDRSSPKAFAKKMHLDPKEYEDYDNTLAKVIASTPTIGGYFYNFETNDDLNSPLIPAIFIEKGAQQENLLISPSHLVLNIPPLQNNFYSSGFFNNTPDEGGMIRRVPLIMRFDNTIYPSLALEMVRIYTGAKRVMINNSAIGVEHISVDKLSIPTDRFARLIVNYRGGGHHFRYISAVDILNNTFKPDDVRGKFVLVGTSAIGLADLRAMPFDDLMPGVEVHANVIDNLLMQDFIALPQHPEITNILLIAATVMTTFLIFIFLNAYIAIPFFILMLYGSYLFFMQMLFHYGLILNILFPFAAMILSFITTTVIDYLISIKQKRLIMSIFAKKVSPSVMKDLIEHNSSHLLTPRTKEVTVFFSDIRSFTSISEKLGDPEQVINMLNIYMTPMVDVITKYHGTVDKFIGDAVMAYWNAPVAIDQHADKAISSALEQLQQLAILNRRLQKEFGIEIHIGIGIHTGEVTIGEMGSEGRSDYTIIGDNVNLASRLEGLNKLYGTSIIISDKTYAALEQTYPLRSLDIVKVKGKEKAVEIYEVLTRPLEQTELTTYNQAISAYRHKHITVAHEHFTMLNTHYPSTLYLLYLTRCEVALQSEISHFDPITKMQTK